jgi:hypothetical protein
MADFDSSIGQHDAHKYSASNPHPMHGKDPNIMNELGHTYYPKYVHEYDDKGAIVYDKVVLQLTHPTKGSTYDSLQHPSLSQHSRIVNNEDEEKEANGDGYFFTHVEAKAANKTSKKTVEKDKLERDQAQTKLDKDTKVWPEARGK